MVGDESREVNRSPGGRAHGVLGVLAFIHIAKPASCGVQREMGPGSAEDGAIS